MEGGAREIFLILRILITKGKRASNNLLLRSLLKVWSY